LHTPNCNFDCAILKYWIIKVIGSGRITSDVWLDPNYYRGGVGTPLWLRPLPQDAYHSIDLRL